MGLSALDYVFFTNNQLHHQQWLEQTHFRTRELQEQLAEQAAANQGHLAIVRAIQDAYEADDLDTLKAILESYETRTAIYQQAYFPTYNRLMPT
jgi:Rps23 Pro-64 3,4-dihydroxylase Tpa1-like proline 4-hydroxylase